MVQSEIGMAVIRRELEHKLDSLKGNTHWRDEALQSARHYQDKIDALQAEIRDLEEELPAPIVEDATAPLGSGEWMF